MISLICGIRYTILKEAGQSYSYWRWRVDRMGEGGQKVQTSVMSSGCIMYSMITIVNNTVSYI